MIQNPLQKIQQFKQFLSAFNGDPRMEVQRLLASGQLTQAQLNELQIEAREFQKLLMNNR